MSISEKTKTITNKIEQNKAQHKWDWTTAKISDLSSENVSKYEFLTHKDVLFEKDLLEKAVALKRFKYSLLGKVFAKQTDVIKKHTEVINKKEDKRSKLLKTIVTKYHDKVENALLYLPKVQVEKYVGIDKKMKPEHLVYGKHNLIHIER